MLSTPYTWVQSLAGVIVIDGIFVGWKQSYRAPTRKYYSSHKLKIVVLSACFAMLPLIETTSLRSHLNKPESFLIGKWLCKQKDLLPLLHRGSCINIY